MRKSALMGCMSQRGGWASAISMAVMPRLHRSDLGRGSGQVERLGERSQDKDRGYLELVRGHSILIGFSFSNKDKGIKEKDH